MHNISNAILKSQTIFLQPKLEVGESKIFTLYSAANDGASFSC